jgi:NTP pyrophosphatase (non-canonical NTP hydrolase)
MNDNMEDVANLAYEAEQTREYFKGKRDTFCPTLGGVVSNYYHFRGYDFPTDEEAFNWLVAEVGELSEAMVEQKRNWIRNNPTERKKDIEAEIGDVLMMLTALCLARNTDPLTCMINKMQSKMFNPENEYRFSK